MATGIKSTNSSTNFTDTVVVTDGIGIDLENDKSTFTNTKIFAGDTAELSKLGLEWGLPQHTPAELIAQAIEDGKTAKSPAALDNTALKAWLIEQGLYTVSYWSSIVLSIIFYVKS